MGKKRGERERERKGREGEREGKGKGRGTEGQEKRPVLWFSVVGNPSYNQKLQLYLAYNRSYDS